MNNHLQQTSAEILQNIYLAHERLVNEKLGCFHPVFSTSETDTITYVGKTEPPTRPAPQCERMILLEKYHRKGIDELFEFLRSEHETEKVA